MHGGDRPMGWPPVDSSRRLSEQGPPLNLPRLSSRSPACGASSCWHRSTFLSTCPDASTPPALYPHFFYGFLSVTLAWQIAFLMIGSSPARLRPMMIPSILEKLGYVVTVILLYRQARISAAEASSALPDLLLGVLFIVAFAKTRTSGG